MHIPAQFCWLARWSDRQVPSPGLIELAIRFHPHDASGHRRLFRRHPIWTALGLVSGR